MDSAQSRPASAPLGETVFPDVLAAAQANAPWAYRRLFDAFGAAIAGYLRTQGASDSDDLANRVFSAAFRALGGFEGDEARFRSWLFTIAHNQLVDDRRRRARRPQTTALTGAEPVPVAQGGSAEEEAFARLGDDWVREMLSRLSPEQRDVLLLRILGDMTVEAIAAALGKRPGAVKALQRRGLGALRRHIERDGAGMSGGRQGVPL